MKKVFTLLFLLICGLIILLATVDLAPYLAPENPQPQATPTDLTKDNLEENNTVATNTSDIKNLVPIFSTVNLEPDLAPENLQPQATPTHLTKDNPETQINELTDDSRSINRQAAPADLTITLLPEGEYPFSILLETFNEQASARQAIPGYHEHGISAYWAKVALGDKRIKYRLFTGIFPTAEAAQHYLDLHNLSTKLIKPTIYSASIGVYHDKEQLSTAFAKTRETGVIPYVLGTDKGAYYLYVGAFYTYVGATAQCSDLIAEGVSCKPVKRSTLSEE